MKDFWKWILPAGTDETAAFGWIPALAGLALLSLILLILCIVLLHSNRNLRRKEQTYHEIDILTGLVNKEGLRREYDLRVKPGVNRQYTLFFFYVGMDTIDKLGCGEDKDNFFRYASECIRKYQEPGDVTARVCECGMAVLRQKADADGECAWSETVKNEIKRYFNRKPSFGKVELSASVYAVPEHGQPLEDTIYYACQSAINALKNGKNHICCTEALIREIRDGKDIGASFEKGMEQKEFQLYMQLYAEANTMNIIGGEALSRWNHAQRGLLEPKRYVPTLEKEGLISVLDYWTLEQVCAFLQDLRKNGIEWFSVSCNFSRVTFSEAAFIRRCMSIMEQYDFPWQRLFFELTESIILTEEEQICRNMEELRKKGIKIVLDDFGEGFTSFYDLQWYPFSVIKLDKHLIDYIDDKKGRMILQSMIDLGQKIGLKVCAEGVETQDQIRKLSEMRCDILQGFSVHRPEKADKVKEKLIGKSVR